MSSPINIDPTHKEAAPAAPHREIPPSPAPPEKAGPEPPPTDRRARSPLLLVRWAFASASVLVFLVATFAASRQPLPLNPMANISVGKPAWWLQPHEKDGEQRLLSNMFVTDIFALPGGKHLWMTGRAGSIQSSEDGGRSWRFQYRASVGLHNVHFVDPEYGWAVGAKGAMIATSDGGNSWQPQELGTSADLRAVHFVDRKRGWAVGRRNMIFRTTNGGDTWKRQYPPEFDQYQPDLSDVYFVNAQFGWVVGDDGLVLSTTDSGASWTLQSTGTNRFLRSVHFVDQNRGWVVGDDGTILATIDGGTNWTQQNSSVTSTLKSVYFIDESRGCAVGSSTMIRTSDGGGTWVEQQRGVELNLRLVRFADKRVGWAASSFGAVFATQNAGRTWVRQSVSPTYLSIQLTNRQDGLVVGRTGYYVKGDGRRSLGRAVGRTQNAGREWSIRDNVASGLSGVCLVDDRIAWAVGLGGTIMITTNGGESWEPQDSKTDASLRDVHFADINMGWVVGRNGTILATNDGGTTWRRQGEQRPESRRAAQLTPNGNRWGIGLGGPFATPAAQSMAPQAKNSDLERATSADLYSVHFVDSRAGWVVGDKGTILATTNGGDRWEPQQSSVVDHLRDVHFVSHDVGWAVGYNGTILTTRNGGSKWTVQRATTRRLFSVHFENERVGWIVGEAGTILATTNGGQTWMPQGSGTIHNLYSVDFVDARTGWAVGAGGTILATTDGGGTWRDQRPHRRYPAPWYYLACLLSVSLLVPTMRRPPPIVTAADAIEDRAYSDRPIEFGDPDPLDFGSVARGVANFLTNPNTTAPLTVAITGRWGSGKSSLMNLVKGDLERRGFRPVWFNAWHQQKEEHLLAALIETIRGAGVPGWLHREGVRYRAKLFWDRSKRRWPRMAFLLVAIGGLIGFSIKSPAVVRQASADLTRVFNLSTWSTWLPSTTPTPTSVPATSTDDTPRAATSTGPVNGANDDENSTGSLPLELAGFLAVLGTAIAGIFTVVSNLRSFGIDPAKLLAGATERPRLRDLRARASLRHRFAREFRDVTEALKPRRLVIFIDDLDRCRPENVLSVLEAVNFLTTCGDCFVILGIDRAQVQRAVGLACKDVADEMIDEELGAAAALDNGRYRRARYARNYLEKLINVELDVPTPTGEESAKLLAPPDTGAAGWRSRVWGELRVFAPFLFALSVLAGGIIAGHWIAPEDTNDGPVEPRVVQEAEQAKMGGPIGHGNKGQPAEATSRPLATQPTTSATMETPTRTGTPGVLEQDNLSLWWLFWVVPLATFAVWRLTVAADELAVDSPRFVSAMAAVHPLLHESPRNTPRSIKRFANRVRFMAMRIAAEAREQPERFSKQATEEEVLVFLAAVEHHRPALREAEPSDEQLRAEVDTAIANARAAPDRFKSLVDLAQRVTSAHGVERFRDRYRQLSTSFRM